MADDINRFKDMTIDGVKALFPEMGSEPIFHSNGGSSNPGVRLITNDDKLNEMLKVVWFPDMELARNVAEALGECDEFLLNPDGKPNPLVAQRVEWIKNLCAALCSYNARFADIYKQTAIGVATTAVTEKGASLLQMPLGRSDAGGMERQQQQKGNGRRP